MTTPVWEQFLFPPQKVTRPTHCRGNGARKHRGCGLSFHLDALEVSFPRLEPPISHGGAPCLFESLERAERSFKVAYLIFVACHELMIDLINLLDFIAEPPAFF